jgi:hypothetical protein
MQTLVSTFLCLLSIFPSVYRRCSNKIHSNVSAFLLKLQSWDPKCTVFKHVQAIVDVNNLLNIYLRKKNSNKAAEKMKRVFCPIQFSLYVLWFLRNETNQMLFVYFQTSTVNDHHGTWITPENNLDYS